MHRALVILLMLIIPIQFAWSAVANGHGHMDIEGSSSGFHVHHDDHDHDHEGGNVGGHGNDTASSDLGNPDHDADDHHDGHHHPAFTMLIPDGRQEFVETLPHAAPWRPLPTFISRTPLLFDWPPAVLS